MKRDLPKSVFEKSGRYYLVRADGKKRNWIALSKVKEGLPGLYLALARESAQHGSPAAMPALIAEWQAKVMPKHAEKTQRDDIARCKLIADSFADFLAEQMEPVGIGEFLEQFSNKPRTFNAYREMLRELMRFAETRGYRPVGTNPTSPIRTMPTPARERYITDSELRRIKVAAMRGKDGKDTRVGPMICALVDMAYLTGQRIGDLLTLEWAQVGRDGIVFKTSKTGARILVEWTPKLRDVETRLRAFKQRNIRTVFATQDGQPYTYWGASTAWRRACERAGIKAHFHDLRAKAMTDKEAREGMQEARKMGGHTTEAQTAEYVRNKSSTKTGATR